MTQEGRVVKSDGETAYVSVTRASACAHDCEKCGSMCHEKKQIIVPTINIIGAKVGDFVRIESSTKTVLKQAFIVYMIPIIVFLGSYISLNFFRFSDVIAVGLSCLALFLSIGVIMFYDKKVGREGENPTIIKIF